MSEYRNAVYKVPGNVSTIALARSNIGSRHLSCRWIGSLVAAFFMLIE